MSKRKLWVSVASLALVVVVGVAAIFSVLAALSANVSSGFNITYKAKNVKGMLFCMSWVNVSGKYTNETTYKDYPFTRSISLNTVSLKLEGREQYYVEFTGDEKGTATNSFENYTVEIDSSEVYNELYDIFKNGDGDYGPAEGFGTDPTGVFTWKIDSINLQYCFLNFGDVDTPAKCTVDNVKCDTDYEMIINVPEDGSLMMVPSGFSSYEEFKANTKQILVESQEMSWEEFLVATQQGWDSFFRSGLPYSEENVFLVYALMSIGDNYFGIEFKINTENYVGFSLSGNVNITLGDLG